MNEHRYRNYLVVADTVRSDVFTAAEREILRDAAEGLLLARTPADGTEEIAMQVSAVLDELVAGDRLRYATAVELRARIEDCGPGAELLRV